MAFIKCSIEKTETKKGEFLNNPVNLALVTSFCKNFATVNQTFEIVFWHDGNDKTVWSFESEPLRNEIYDKLDNHIGCKTIYADMDMYKNFKK